MVAVPSLGEGAEEAAEVPLVRLLVHRLAVVLLLAVVHLVVHQQAMVDVALAEGEVWHPWVTVLVFLMASLC